MEQADKTSKEISKAGVEQLVRLGLRFSKVAAKYIISTITPILAPIAVPLILFIIVFTVLFLFPKYMMDTKPPSSGFFNKVISIFNLGEKDNWTEEMDQELALKYRNLSDETWQNGFLNKKDLKEVTDKYFWSDIDFGSLPSEQDQTFPHRLPWSLLAGVDRIAGDPITRREKVRKPAPDKHQEALKPEFTWNSFSAVKVEKIVTIDKKGNRSVTYITHTASIRILDTVKTFEGNYKYTWKEKKSYYSDGHLESIMPTIETVEKSGPYFKTLIELMNSYQITDLLEIETVLELAELYDDEYKIDAGNLGNRVTTFQVDLTKQYFTGPKGSIFLPVAARYFTIPDPYGPRIHPLTGKWNFHTGIDIAAPMGAQVFSAFRGVVIWSGNKGGYGKAIIVDHGDILTLYGHLSFNIAKPGDEVEPGAVIGLVGSTGDSTGAHLHFEIMKKKPEGGISYEDPMGFFNSK